MPYVFLQATEKITVKNNLNVHMYAYIYIYIYTRLKNKIKNSSTWEGAFIKMNELKLTQVQLF